LRHLLLILFVLFLISCGHKYETSKELEKEFEKRVNQKSDTLIVGHDECTECLDLYISQGKLTIPNDVKLNSSFFSDRDFNVCGKFPMDLIDNSTFNFDPYLSFKIIGKVIKADTTNGIGSVPLFYVDSWTKFHFDKASWQKKGDLNLYPQRPKMVDGVVENLIFAGQHISTITNFLGEPDQKEQNKITYDIDTKYGSDIDPVSSTYLTIVFNKDSIITNKTLNTTKNGR